MMTSRIDAKWFGISSVAAAALSFGLWATAAHADSVKVSDGVPSLLVKYADLDLSTDAGARTLYARLAAASKRVCPDPGSRDLRMLSLTGTCRQQALDRAVRAVNNTALAAVHSRRAPNS
jgi:UrcA family protein